jgi:hypothetical protein
VQAAIAYISKKNPVATAAAVSKSTAAKKADAVAVE